MKKLTFLSCAFGLSIAFSQIAEASSSKSSLKPTDASGRSTLKESPVAPTNDGDYTTPEEKQRVWKIAASGKYAPNLVEAVVNAYIDLFNDFFGQYPELLERFRSVAELYLYHITLYPYYKDVKAKLVLLFGEIAKYHNNEKIHSEKRPENERRNLFRQNGLAYVEDFKTATIFIAQPKCTPPTITYLFELAWINNVNISAPFQAWSALSEFNFGDNNTQKIFKQSLEETLKNGKPNLDFWYTRCKETLIGERIANIDPTTSKAKIDKTVKNLKILSDGNLKKFDLYAQVFASMPDIPHWSDKQGVLQQAIKSEKENNIPDLSYLLEFSGSKVPSVEKLGVLKTLYETNSRSEKNLNEFIVLFKEIYLDDTDIGRALAYVIAIMEEHKTKGTSLISLGMRWVRNHQLTQSELATPRISSSSPISSISSQNATKIGTKPTATVKQKPNGRASATAAQPPAQKLPKQPK